MVFTLKTWLPWQQGLVYTYHLDFKILPIHVGEKSQDKVSRQNPFPFQRYLSKATKEGEKHPPLSPQPCMIKKSEILNV